MFPIGDDNRPLKKPYVNYALIAANIVIFLFFLFQGLRSLSRAIATYGVIPAYILSGMRLQTLLTSMFLHADILHLLGNMLYLWIFGDDIEDALGHARYLAFYLIGGVFASIVHIYSTLLSLYTSPIPYVVSGLRTPAVGASGAISAVLGAYMLMYPNARIRTLVFYFFIVTVVSIPAYYYLGFWFIYQLLMGVISLTGLSSGVAFWAHIGGFLFGVTVAWVSRAMLGRRRVEEAAYRPIVAPWVRAPLVDIYVEADRVLLMAYMPGLEGGNIRVSVSTWDVVIDAERGDVRYHGRINLPVPVIPGSATYEYVGGVLYLTLHRLNGSS